MKKKRIVKYALALLLVCSVTIGSFYAYSVYSAADNVIKSVTSSGNLADILEPEALDGESIGQVNILIAGNSADQINHDGAQLTDSIMVASINVKTYKISLISIPRDTWVSYNDSSSKINAVYVSGGMAGLKSVVEEVTGLTINHTVLINYTALASLIDMVGGIDVDIKSDNDEGIYDPMLDNFKINGGMQHINGTQALLLARARNDPTYDGRIAYGLSGGDFDRQENQRRIVEALMVKIKSSDALINPSTLKKLFQDLNGNVSTNLSVGQVRRLYDISKEVSSTESISLQQYLSNYTAYDGQSALIPSAGQDNYTQIQSYIQSQLGLSSDAVSSTGSDSD